jgi:hypothetical protein
MKGLEVVALVVTALLLCGFAYFIGLKLFFAIHEMFL